MKIDVSVCNQTAPFIGRISVEKIKAVECNRGDTTSSRDAIFPGASIADIHYGYGFAAILQSTAEWMREIKKGAKMQKKRSYQSKLISLG